MLAVAATVRSNGAVTRARAPREHTLSLFQATENQAKKMFSVMQRTATNTLAPQGCTANQFVAFFMDRLGTLKDPRVSVLECVEGDACTGSRGWSR